MSTSRSDQNATGESDEQAEQLAADPLRPADHIDGGGGEGITQPRLGIVGWMRWGWRQLTSMRVAIILLLLLAVAAIPGSIFPQRSADPNGVLQYKNDNPDLFPTLDAIKLFDVYSSPWFSAIYLLLFVSLIGCIIPRIKHHYKALRAQPPRTPARLGRLDDFRSVDREAEDADAEAAQAIDVAQKQLKALGYRVSRYDRGSVRSVSAERGYLRETGNLVFHIALVGVLIAVGIGGGFKYTGQKVVVEGGSFVNTPVDYASLDRGRFVAEDALVPYAMRLDSFDITYEPPDAPGAGQAGNFSANVSVQEGDKKSKGHVRVNHPLTIGPDRVYLLGNGYAPTITVRNADDEVVFSGPVEFLPQDNATMTSLGVLKVPDGMPEQLGMMGFFYPTAVQLDTGAFASAYPDLANPLLTLDVYEGDLGIDDGTPRSVYVLDTDNLTKLNGRDTDVDSIQLAPGETADLPKGLGTVTFEDARASGADEAVTRYVSLQIHHDASGPWVLGFAALAFVGLALALFLPRRRMWVKATPGDGVITLEYAGLARGDDPTLAAAVDDLASGHERLMGRPAARTPSEED